MRRRRWLTLAVALSLIGCQSYDTAHAQELFYIVNKTERIELTRSSKTVAVRASRGREEAFGEFVGGLDGIEALEMPELRREFGIFLLRSRNPSLGLGSILDRVSQSPMVESDLPVFESGAIELLFAGTYKVRFRRNTSSADITSTLQDIGAENIDDADRDTGRYVFEVPGASFEQGLDRVNDLNVLEIVRYAQPNFVRVYPPRMNAESAFRTAERIEADGRIVAQSGSSSACNPDGSLLADPALPSDPMFENQWSLHNTGDNPLQGKLGADVGYVDALPNVAATSARIAILDLGIDSDHDDLTDMIVDEFDATGAGDPAPQDPSNYHGTRVAGIAGAQVSNKLGVAGIARNAQLISVRIAQANCGTCGWVTTNGSEWRGIREAVKLKADVIVNSWAEAGGGFDSDIYAEIADAIEAGAVLVFSAGNHLWEIGQDELGNFFIDQGPSEVMFPASLAATAADEFVRLGLLAVSATNQHDELKTHEYEQQTTKSQDNETGWGSNRGPAVSLAAPGVHLYTTDVNNEYACMSGTSAAAPLVGGVAAILKHQFPEATPAQIKHWLQSGADKLYLADDGLDRDDFIGYGRLNLAGALQAAMAEADPNPNRPNRPTGLMSN